LIEAEIEPRLAYERSQDAIIEIQGALIVVRILDEPAIFTRILNNMPKKLL
jgi:TetR/AcrR family transcriptional regulator, lmrAB and yxaGH operons repressor